VIEAPVEKIGTESNPKRNRRRTILGVTGLVAAVALGGIIALRSLTSIGQSVPAPFSLPDRPNTSASSDTP
jgi:hypothetical protein